MLQGVVSFSDNTYPYRHIDKYTTTDYVCWYPQCKQDIATVKDSQAVTLSKWNSLAPTLRNDADVVKQFARLETMFQYANYFNLTQCIQDFDQVLTLQEAVYNNVFNICVAESTKQNLLDYTSDMSALIDIVIHLDADTKHWVLQCGPDNECKQHVESSALDQLQNEEQRGLILIDWYEKKMLFDNVNSVTECVEFKTFEQVGDMKKIINTVEDCLHNFTNTTIQYVTPPLQ